jgi:hypothetical protein
MKGSIPGEHKRLFCIPVSRPALGLTQLLMQWVQRAPCPGIKSGRGMKLTTHLHLANGKAIPVTGHGGP